MAENNEDSDEVADNNIDDSEDISTTELPTTTEFEELETTEKNQTNRHNRHKRMASFDSDISAGQFYYGIIDILE
jgi:hypothetical protein